jgi:sugar (pentulose or hexulose) kinase
METLVLCGGGVKSSIWLPVVVDVLGRNGVAPKSADASFGVALMAGQAMGLFDAGEAADRSRADGKTVSFNPENHLVYTGIFKRYREIAPV